MPPLEGPSLRGVVVVGPVLLQAKRQAPEGSVVQIAPGGKLHDQADVAPKVQGAPRARELHRRHAYPHARGETQAPVQSAATRAGKLAFQNEKGGASDKGRKVGRYNGNPEGACLTVTALGAQGREACVLAPP